MAMKHAVQVRVADQLRQLVFRGPGNFIATFAQLRLDKLKAEGFVDVFFAVPP